MIFGKEQDGDEYPDYTTCKGCGKSILKTKSNMCLKCYQEPNVEITTVDTDNPTEALERMIASTTSPTRKSVWR